MIKLLTISIENETISNILNQFFTIQVPFHNPVLKRPHIFIRYYVLVTCKIHQNASRTFSMHCLSYSYNYLRVFHFKIDIIRTK